jgi:hypothetical protein
MLYVYCQGEETSREVQFAIYGYESNDDDDDDNNNNDDDANRR